MTTQPSSARSQGVFVRKVRDFEDLYDNPQVVPPSGIVFSNKLDRFLTFQSGASNATTSEVTAITRTDIVDSGRSLRLGVGISNPLNTAFDNRFNRLLSFQNNQLVEVGTNADGSLAPEKIKRVTLRQQFGVFNPRGISIDPNTGTIYVLNSGLRGSEIVQIQPGADGGLEGAIVSRIALSIPARNLRGIAFDPTTGRFQVLSPSEQQLYEINASGQILATRDVSQLGLRNPQSIVFAPSGDQTDDAKRLSLYVSDSTPGGGGIVELSFVEPQNLQPTSSATLVRIVPTSQFSPASPDPSGIAYLNQSNRLMISDGEVDEMPALFTGKNLFEVNLAGNLEQTFTTTAFSAEPTGITYNPTNRFLYFTDDNSDRVFQLNPGADLIYNTSDDFASSLFSTRTFNSFDPEDLVYSTTLGDLFLVDGVNAEVYRVTLGGTLVSQFDTEQLGILDPEGITLLDNGNLAIVGRPTNVVAEVTTSGSLVRLIDISAANPIKPAGLAFAPNSQNPSQRSLYIVDRGIDNSVDPNENDGRMYEFSLGTTAVNQAPSANAGLDQVIVLRAFLDGAVFDDGLPSGFLSTSWSQVSGSGVVTFENPSAQDTAATFSTPGTYTLRLTATDGALSANDDVVVQVLDPQSTLFISPLASGTVGGVAFENEDILAVDRNTGQWFTYFDGSDVGLSSFVLRGVHINNDGTLLLAVNNTATLPGVGTIEATDILRFVPTSLGNTTAGTFELYFDGSDVGLDNNNERIDAIAIAPDGRLIISTLGSVTVPGVNAADEDLLAFSPTSLGANTAGSWSLYFDGSDVGLTDNSEDIDGVSIDRSGAIYLSTEGAYNVPGAAGNGSDILRFLPTSLGSNTLGTYSPFWNPTSNGFPAGVQIGGVSQVF